MEDNNLNTLISQVLPPYQVYRNIFLIRRKHYGQFNLSYYDHVRALQEAHKYSNNFDTRRSNLPSQERFDLDTDFSRMNYDYAPALAAAYKKDDKTRVQKENRPPIRTTLKCATKLNNSLVMENDMRKGALMKGVFKHTVSLEVSLKKDVFSQQDVPEHTVLKHKIILQNGPTSFRKRTAPTAPNQNLQRTSFQIFNK